MKLEDKIKIIDLICQRHPSCGVDKGWSEYTGGMKDSGQWFFRKMLDAPEQDLVDFHYRLVEDESKPIVELSEEDKRKSKVILSNGHGGWYSQLGKEQMEEYVRQQERITFGLFIDPNKDKK